jgi:hypothetical protein
MIGRVTCVGELGDEGVLKSKEGPVERRRSDVIASHRHACPNWVKYHSSGGIRLFGKKRVFAKFGDWLRIDGFHVNSNE